MTMNMKTAMEALSWLADEIHQRNIDAGWWTDLETGKPAERNMGEMLMLIVTEIAEAMEGVRKGIPDDKLPQYPMLNVELIDALVREFDVLGYLQRKSGLTVGEVFLAKIEFNANRADHKIENRKKDGGKKS